MADIGAGWERIVLPWDRPASGPNDFSDLGITIAPSQLQAELNRGVKVAGLLQFTPAWAAANPDGRRSPPRNLDLPYDHPDNYWGRFVYETVKLYPGRIDEWVIWNEPEFRPGDAGAGGTFTWLGTDEEFAQLLKVGYLAVKRANPNAIVSFPGTSYWVDQLSAAAVLRTAAEHPASRSGRRRQRYYHDVVSLNLYRAPDDSSASTRSSRTSRSATASTSRCG